jgi:GTP-binding protein
MSALSSQFSDLPFVVIVGCPNVGKSTLFNRLLGVRRALVKDYPGLTRDVQCAQLDVGGRWVQLCDTPGIFHEAPDPLNIRMKALVEPYLRKAACILFVVDGRRDLTLEEQHFSRWLREQNLTPIVLVNKCDGGKIPTGFFEAFRLGFEPTIPISAEHGDGTFDIFNEIEAALERCSTFPKNRFEGEDHDVSTSPKSELLPLKLAIVGRPNVGKSTLVNQLLKEDRMLTGEEAGLTRDAIASTFIWKGRDIHLVDTAGLGRKVQRRDDLTHMMHDKTYEAVQFAHVVVVVLDICEKLSKQDLSILSHVENEGRCLVIALNKVDHVLDLEKRLDDLRQQLKTTLAQVPQIPIVPMSALEGRGINQLMKTVTETEIQWRRRIPTGPLNAFLKGCLADNPPPRGTIARIKIKYISQIKTAPPTFVLFGNQMGELPTSYRRYLLNRLRKRFSMEGVVIRLLCRSSDNPFDPKPKGAAQPRPCHKKG